MNAAREGHMDMVAMLIEVGADPNIEDNVRKYHSNQ